MMMMIVRDEVTVQILFLVFGPCLSLSSMFESSFLDLALKVKFLLHGIVEDYWPELSVN